MVKLTSIFQLGPKDDALLRAHENSGVIVRPFLDPDTSKSVIDDQVAHIQSKASVTGLCGVRNRCPRRLAPCRVIRATDEERAAFDPFELRRHLWL